MNSSDATHIQNHAIILYNKDAWVNLNVVYEKEVTPLPQSDVTEPKNNNSIVLPETGLYDIYY
ncbi:MAG: hypothetical protein LBR40_06285 [Bacilli bacterium]|nr:hypothetical protein [Bacilli bacterium]